jgi:hypothetical protein
MARMRAPDLEARLHWVTEGAIALLAAVLLSGVALSTSLGLWGSLTLAVGALGVPVARALFRRWRLRGPRFILSEQRLVLLDEARPLPLAHVQAFMFMERGRWEVLWHFGHRRSLRTTLSEADAARVRSVLGAQVRVVESSHVVDDPARR